MPSSIVVGGRRFFRSRVRATAFFNLRMHGDNTCYDETTQVMADFLRTVLLENQAAMPDALW